MINVNRYDYKIICVDGSEALCHHGIKGMKWGVRRYQNPDGTLTEAGKKRYIRQQVGATGGATGALGAYGGAIAGGVIAGGINPALTPSGMKAGAVVGGALGGIVGGRYAYKISKEATKGKIKDEDVSAKAHEIASNKAFAKQDFKAAFKSLKDSGYFDQYPKEIRDGYLKAGKTSNSIEEFDKKTLLKYGDHASDLMWEAIEDARDARRAMSSGGEFVATQAHMTAVRAHQNMVDQVNTQNFVNQQIAFSNQQASLSMTYGMNPAMF